VPGRRWLFVLVLFVADTRTPFCERILALGILEAIPSGSLVRQDRDRGPGDGMESRPRRWGRFRNISRCNRRPVRRGHTQSASGQRGPGGIRLLAARRTVLQHGGRITLDQSGQMKKLISPTLPLYNGQDK
jgi:hypothetical protein